MTERLVAMDGHLPNPGMHGHILVLLVNPSAGAGDGAGGRGLRPTAMLRFSDVSYRMTCSSSLRTGTGAAGVPRDAFGRHRFQRAGESSRVNKPRCISQPSKSLSRWSSGISSSMHQVAIYRLAHRHTLTAQQAEVLCALHCQFGPDHLRESHERITNLCKIAKAMENFR